MVSDIPQKSVRGKPTPHGVEEGATLEVPGTPENNLWRSPLHWLQTSLMRGPPYSGNECCEKALSLKADCVDAWFHLGRAGGREVEFQSYSQQKCLEKALSLNPTLQNGWQALGATSREGEIGGKTYSEKKCYEKALVFDPELLDAWIKFGVV